MMDSIPRPEEASAPAPLEAPSPAAELKVATAAWWEASGPWGFTGKGGGSFPPSETPLVVKTFGITVMGLGGITGFILTLQLALSHVEGWALALAELAFTLVVIFLIAFRDQRSAYGPQEPHAPGGRQPQAARAGDRKSTG